MGTIRKPSKTTKTAPFPLSIPKPMTLIRVLWAWKNTSHIAATPAGNATKTSTVSNTTRTTPQTVIPRFRPRTRIPPPRLTDPTSRPTKWSCKKGKIRLKQGAGCLYQYRFFFFFLCVSKILFELAGCWGVSSSQIALQWRLGTGGRIHTVLYY